MLPILSKRILFVGGKGGVGKTTVSAAIALQAAQLGKRVLLVSTDPAHSLADAFDLTIGDPSSEQEQEQYQPLLPNIDALEIDPDKQVRAHINRVMRTMKRFARPQMYGEIERQMRLTEQSPGAQEAALLERIAKIIDSAPSQYDLVIFDTAPTGHTLRLLTLPEAMAAWTQGLLRQTKKSEQLEGVLAHLSAKSGRDIANPMGDPTTHETAEMDDRTAEITATLQQRQSLFHRIRHQLTDAQQCGIVFVLTPEKLPILETTRAVQTLQAEHLPVAGLVINRNVPDAIDSEFFAQRRQQEAIYREQIQAQFSSLPQLYLPLFPTDLHGVEALRAISAKLQLS
ncbi:ArsA family ATPase [Pseudidiomarina sp. WS423]|uniref:ArsA family ATPase n=1 Tax=Pseudidiomarina sp. WS423 TaxID=3425124 RepID=UPI003D6E9B24